MPFFLLVILSLCFFQGWIDLPTLSGAYFTAPKFESPPLRCTRENQTCPRDYPTFHNPRHSSHDTCPSYFRWIHEDLWPWKETGITRDMVERGSNVAHFRLVILNGKLYVEKYKQSLETRDLFTLWSILQLTRLYPGRLPDLDLMFESDDLPVVKKSAFELSRSAPPPVFRYCSDEDSIHIMFPDWSFWGWGEINLKPWTYVIHEISEGNKRTQWQDRIPYAYWKGNPAVTGERYDLLTCNISEGSDWNSRLYINEWKQASKEGYKNSQLEDQCTHRYKIYIQGYVWSASEKYILACNSMNLYIRSPYYDFFIREMMPLQHHWPIRSDSKCKSLKYAVDWGNKHPDKAQAMGEAASNFIEKGLSMDNVYDYMFNVLNEYAKLLRFRPKIPPHAVEFCPETLACSQVGPWRKLLEDSMVMSPSDTTPCTLPPPSDPAILRDMIKKKKKTIRQVEKWEEEHWQNADQPFDQVNEER